MAALVRKMKIYKPIGFVNAIFLDKATWNDGGVWSQYFSRRKILRHQGGQGQEHTLPFSLRPWIQLLLGEIAYFFSRLYDIHVWVRVKSRKLFSLIHMSSSVYSLCVCVCFCLVRVHMFGPIFFQNSVAIVLGRRAAQSTVKVHASSTPKHVVFFF